MNTNGEQRGENVGTCTTTHKMFTKRAIASIHILALNFSKKKGSVNSTSSVVLIVLQSRHMLVEWVRRHLK